MMHIHLIDEDNTFDKIQLQWSLREKHYIWLHGIMVNLAVHCYYCYPKWIAQTCGLVPV